MAAGGWWPQILDTCPCARRSPLRNPSPMCLCASHSGTPDAHPCSVGLSSRAPQPHPRVPRGGPCGRASSQPSSWPGGENCKQTKPPPAGVGPHMQSGAGGSGRGRQASLLPATPDGQCGPAGPESVNSVCLSRISWWPRETLGRLFSGETHKHKMNDLEVQGGVALSVRQPPALCSSRTFPSPRRNPRTH